MQRYQSGHRILDTLLKRRIYHRFRASQFSEMILIYFLGGRIRVYAIKGNWHLDKAIQSKIMAMVFSMAAEIKRGLNSARTKEALTVERPR